MKIYLVELESGEHDDYGTSPVKAFENETEAQKFTEICNKDMVILLEKLRIFQDKQYKKFKKFENKFGIDFIDEPEYIDWSGKQGEEEKEIFKFFIHENITDICPPAEYIITEIELIKENKKT
jgi:hypothetical protein